MSGVRDLGLGLLNWFYPKRCAACRSGLHYKENALLCPFCSETVLKIEEPCCKRCGIHLPDGGAHCFHCRNADYHFTLARSHAVFEGPVRKAIHRFKYGGLEALAKDLARMMLSAWERFPDLQRAEVLVPVPLHPVQQRERGYNQSALLAREFQKLAGNPALRLEETVLVRIRRTVSQTGLDRAERRRNMAGAFALRDPGPVKARTVLLVDDVCTTGATLDACAAALKSAGAREVLALTVARD